MGKLDERRTRNIVGVAVFVLVLFYTVKLSIPSHSVHSAYTAMSSYMPKRPSSTSSDVASGSEVCLEYCMPIPPQNTTSRSEEPSPEVAISSTSGEKQNSGGKQTSYEDSEWYLDESSTTIKVDESSTTIKVDESPATVNETDIISIEPDKKVAVIIENRPLMNAIPLIMHFHSVLGDEWPIVVYTKAENIGLFSASAAFQRLVKTGRIDLRTLPFTVLIDNSKAISLFLTKPWFWESLAPAEHILLFQSDSILCSNAAVSVDDFLEWDFIGAPILKGRGAGYNGGLSLRRRSKILEVISRWDFEHDPDIESNRYLSHEDQWYFDKLNKLPKPHLPSMEVARTFSVETIDYPNPLGLHQVQTYQAEHMPELDLWCPEYKLCATDFIKE